jgi:hypothetical protein
MSHFSLAHLIEVRVLNSVKHQRRLKMETQYVSQAMRNGKWKMENALGLLPRTRL